MTTRSAVFTIEIATLLLCIGLQSTDLHGQIRVAEVEGSIWSNSSGSFWVPSEWRVKDQNGNERQVWGLAQSRGPYPTVYTTGQTDERLQLQQSRTDSLEVRYHRQRTSDSLAFQEDVQEMKLRIVSAIDSVPARVISADVVRVMREQILQELRDTELAQASKRIELLEESVATLQREVALLRKKGGQ